MQSSQVRNVGLPSSADSKRDVPAWTQDPKIFPLDWFSDSRPNIIRQTKEYVSKLSKWRNCSKIKTLSKLKAVLKRIMMFLHTHISYIDGKSLLECDLEEDLITLVSLYMDMELRVLVIKKSSPSGTTSTLPVPGPGPGPAADLLVSDRISYWLYTMLSGHDQRMDALLSTTVFTRHTRPVLDPIFRKVLSEMSDGPFTNVNYVRHMLAYKTWRERTLVVDDLASLELNSRVLQQLVPRDYAFPPPLLRCLGKGDNAREHAKPGNINLADACRNFMRYCREIPAAAVEQINFESIRLFDDDLLGDEEDEVNKIMNMISNRKQRKTVPTSPKRNTPQVDAFIDLTLPNSRTSPTPTVDVIDLTEEDEKHVNARTAVVQRSSPTPQLRIAPPVQRDTSMIPQTSGYHALVPSSQPDKLLIPHPDQDFLFNNCITSVRAQCRQTEKTFGYQKIQETVKVPVTERNCETNAKYIDRCFQFPNYLHPCEDDIDTEVLFANSQDQMLKCNRQDESRNTTNFSDILNNCDCDECRQDNLSPNRTCGSAENKTEISDKQCIQSLVTYTQTSTVAEIYGMETAKPITLYPQTSIQFEDQNEVEYFSETLDKRKSNLRNEISRILPSEELEEKSISTISENKSQRSVREDISNTNLDTTNEISEPNAQREIQSRVSDTRIEIDQLCSEIDDLTSPEISICNADFLLQNTDITEISCNTSEELVPDVTVREDNLQNTEFEDQKEENSVILSVQRDNFEVEETQTVSETEVIIAETEENCLIDERQTTENISAEEIVKVCQIDCANIPKITQNTSTTEIIKEPVDYLVQNEDNMNSRILEDENSYNLVQMNENEQISVSKDSTIEDEIIPSIEIETNVTAIEETVIEELVEENEKIKDYTDIPQIIESPKPISNEETNTEELITEESVNHLFPDYQNSTNIQSVEEIAPAIEMVVESEVLVNSEILESDIIPTSHEIQTVSLEIESDIAATASEIETIDQKSSEFESEVNETEETISEINNEHEICSDKFEIEATNQQISESVDMNHSNSEIIVDSEITIASTHEIETINTSSEFLTDTTICPDVEVKTNQQNTESIVDQSNSEIVDSEITTITVSTHETEIEHQKSSEVIDTEICTKIETINEQICSDSATVEENVIAETEICSDNIEIKVNEAPSLEITNEQNNSKHFVDNIEISTNVEIEFTNITQNLQTSKRKRRKVIREEQIVHVDKNIPEMSPTKRKRHIIRDENIDVALKENIISKINDNISVEPINQFTENVQNYEEIISEINTNLEQNNEEVKDNTPKISVPEEQISVDDKRKRRRKQNLKNVRNEKKESSNSDNVKKELRIVCQKLSADDVQVMSKTNQSLENKVAVNNKKSVSRRKNQIPAPNKDIENSLSEMKVRENENKITLNTEKVIKTVDIPSFSDYINKEKEKQNKFRGRPRRKKLDNNENTNKPENVSNFPEINAEKVKRPRGRPPKNNFFSENLNLQNVNSKNELSNDSEDVPLAVRISQSRNSLIMKNSGSNIDNNLNIEEDLPLIERRLKSKPIRTYSSKTKLNKKEENERIENKEVDNEIKSKSYQEKLKMFKFKSRSTSDNNLIEENNLEISKSLKNSKRKHINKSTSDNDTDLLFPIPDIISSSFIKPKKSVHFSDKDDVFLVVRDKEEYIDEMAIAREQNNKDLLDTAKKNADIVIYRAKRNKIKKFREIPNDMQTKNETNFNEISDKSSFNNINIDGNISKIKLNNFSSEEIIPENNFHLTPKKMFSRRAREKLEKQAYNGNLESKDSQIISNEIKVNSCDKQINNFQQFSLEQKLNEFENKPLTEICANYEEENSQLVAEETVITSSELTDTISKFQNEINEIDISKNAKSPIKKTRKSKFKLKLNGKSNFLPMKLNKNVRSSPTLKNRRKKKFKTKLNGNNNNKNIDIIQSEELMKNRDIENDLNGFKVLNDIFSKTSEVCEMTQPEESTIEKTEINLDTNYINNDQTDIDINKTEENTVHLDEISATSEVINTELNEIENNKIEEQIKEEVLSNKVKIPSEEENQDTLTNSGNKLESPKIDNKSADMSYKPCNKIYEKQFDFYSDHDDVSNSELIIDTSAESSDSEDTENKKQKAVVQQQEVPKRKYHHLIEEIVNLNENAERNNFENIFTTENSNQIIENHEDTAVDTFNYSDISDEPQESEQKMEVSFQKTEECIPSNLLSVDESEIKDIVEYPNIADVYVAEMTELLLPVEEYDEFILETRKEETSELIVVPYPPSIEMNINIDVGLESCTIFQQKPLIEEYAKKACVKCSVNGVHKNNGKITIHGFHQYEETDIGECLENCQTIPPISYCQASEMFELNQCTLTAKVESVKISTNDSSPDLDNYNLVFLADIAMSSVHLTTKIDCNSSTSRRESACNQNSMDSHDKCIIVTFPDNMTPTNKQTTSVSVIQDKSKELSINVQTLVENVSPKGVALENKIQALTERVKNSKKSPTENLDELYTSLENICELEINTLTKGVDSQSSVPISTNPLENPKITEPSIPIDIPNTALLHLIPDDDDFMIRNAPFSLQSPPPIQQPSTEIVVNKPNLGSIGIVKTADVDSEPQKSNNKIEEKEEIKTKSKKGKSKSKSSNNQNSETINLLNVYKNNQDTNKNTDVQQNVGNKNTTSPPSYIRSTRPMRMVTTKKRNCNVLENTPQDEPPKKVSASEEMFDLLLEEHRKEQSKTEKSDKNINTNNKTMPILDDNVQKITETTIESNIPLPVLDYEEHKTESRKEETVIESEDVKIEKEMIVQDKKQTDDSTVEERLETDRNASAIEVVQEWFNRVEDKSQVEPYTEITSYQTIEECNFFEEMSDTSENSPNSRKTDDKIFSEHQTPDSGIAFDEDSIHKDKPVPENLSELDESMSEDVNEKIDVQPYKSDKEQLKVSISLGRIQEILPHLKKCKIMSSVQKNRKRKEVIDHEKAKRRKYTAEEQQDIIAEEIVINENKEEKSAPNQKDFPISVRTKGSVKEYPELFGITESPVPSGSFHSPYPSDISLSEEPVFYEEGGIDLCSNDYPIYESFEVLQEQQSLQKEYNVDDNPKDVQQGLQAGYCVVDSQFLPLSEYMNDGDYILVDNKIFNDKKMVPVNMHLVQPETKPHKNEETKKSEFDDSEKEDSLSDTVDEIIKNPNLFPEQSTSEVEVINMDQATSEVQVVIACGTYQETDMSDTYLFGIAVQSEVTHNHNTSIPEAPLPHHSPMTIEELPPDNKVTDSDFKPTSIVGSDNTQICNTNILPATDVPQPEPMDLITTVPTPVTDKILDNKDKLPVKDKKLDDINYKPKTEMDKIRTQKIIPRRTVSDVSNSSKVSSLHSNSNHDRTKIFQNSKEKSMNKNHSASNIIIHQNKLVKHSNYSNKVSNGPNSVSEKSHNSIHKQKVYDLSKKPSDLRTKYEKPSMSEDAFDRLKHDKTDIPPPPDSRRYYNHSTDSIMKTRQRKDTPSGDYYRRYSIERDSSKSRHTSQNFSESRRPHSAYTEPNPKPTYRLPASDPSYRNSHNNYRKPEVKKPDLKQPPPGSSSQKDWLKNENLLSLIKASNTIYSKKY